MIPRLNLNESLKPDCTLFLEALSKTPFAGEIRADFANRLMMSTDNSIYQILPQAVVFPKTEEDLVYLFRLAEQEQFKTIAFSPRSGGTGTNGQSLSPGIIIDCSKYMNQILEINLEESWVRVQPGVILDQLNTELKPYGVFFAPSLAPSNRATIGGMINTDACGQGSRVYGRTSNHILELAWVLPDGTVGRSHAVDPATLTQLQQQPDRLGEIYRQVDTIVTSKRELIEQSFPKMPRFLTGYNLAKVYSQQRNSFNLNWILAGSEGTLAVITEDLRKIKAAFDPDNRLNPGKIVTPLDSSAEVVRVEAPLRGHFDRQVPAAVRSEYEEAFSCNGNGACFNFNPDDVMCPSSKVTRDRIHSPKGRASLLREWLRQLGTAKFEELEKPGSFPLKLWNTLRQFWGVYDYSHEVYQGMHGCLSCKACATQCPIHVDIPSLKAKFLELYYTRYLRHWRDYFIANIETLASWQSHAPVLVNFLTQNPAMHWLIKQFFSMVNPPVLSAFTVKQGLAARQAPAFDLAKLSALSDAERENSVILLQDAFTSFYESQLVLDTYDLLRQLGYTVYVPPFFASGKPLHVKGFVRQFRAIAQKNTEYLIRLRRLGIPIIGIEPSIVLTYRDDYGKMLDSSKTFLGVQLLQEFLVNHRDRLLQIATSEPYYLLGHCTEKTLALASQKQWQQVFQAAGLPLTLVATGCCGMAGIYGHEAEHYNESKGIYQISWGRHIPSNPKQRQHFLATGYSCRSQVKRFDGFVPLHPLQILVKHACIPYSAGREQE